MTDAEAERRIAGLLAAGRVAVLTGAGLSTGCGIPDYRDRDGRWKRAQPVSHQDFVRSEAMRRRYWARSYFGWPTVADAQPGPGHRALARLQGMGRIAALVTQNVDGLHQKAGREPVLELHGGIARVACLDCGGALPRSEMQVRLRAANPHIAAATAAAAPDGDADIVEALHDGFEVPACAACGGVLKPDVVFFGDSVPRPRVAAVAAAIDAAAALLVVGSSLMVYSGYRFAEQAHRRGLPVVAVNLGRTRADLLLAAKVERDCDAFLSELAA